MLSFGVGWQRELHRSNLEPKIKQSINSLIKSFIHTFIHACIQYKASKIINEQNLCFTLLCLQGNLNLVKHFVRFGFLLMCVYVLLQSLAFAPSALTDILQWHNPSSTLDDAVPGDLHCSWSYSYGCFQLQLHVHRYYGKSNIPVYSNISDRLIIFCTERSEILLYFLKFIYLYAVTAKHVC